MNCRGRSPLVLYMALALALLQVGLGLFGVWWSYDRGWQSEGVSIDPEGRVVERTEEHGAEPALMIMSGVVAAGGVIGCAGLWAGRRWRFVGMAGVVAGATLGLPLGYTVVGGLLPLLLAALGTLAVYRMGEQGSAPRLSPG